MTPDRRLSIREHNAWHLPTRLQKFPPSIVSAIRLFMPLMPRGHVAAAKFQNIMASTWRQQTGLSGENVTTRELTPLLAFCPYPMSLGLQKGTIIINKLPTVMKPVRIKNADCKLNINVNHPTKTTGTINPR